MEGAWTTTSEFDPTEAPNELHIVRMETQVPYQIRGKDWKGASKQLAESCIGELKRSLVNPDNIKILKQYSYPSVLS